MSKPKLYIAGFLALNLAIAQLASAEPYVGGYVGASFPSSSDVDAKALGTKVIAEDVLFGTSAVFGGKVGYWLKSFPYVGLEVEAYHHNPGASSQTVSLTANGAPAGTVKLDKLDLGVTTVGFNLLGRVPGKRFQPYVGVGLGIFITRSKDTDTSVGLQVWPG